MRGCLVAAVLVVATGCGRAKKNECKVLRDFVFAEVHWQGAPRQADMSPAGQAANWKWRSERANERAIAAGGLGLTDAQLLALRTDYVAYYKTLADEAKLTSEAWERRDNAGLNQHAGIFDTRMNDRDTLMKRMDDTCR